MDSVWREGPVKRFWDRLLNENVDRLVTAPEQFLLKHMRHDYAMVKDYQKRFGHIFEERGLNLFQLIAKASGEVWDSEDEEKGACILLKKRPPSNQRNHGNHDDLDPARESGVPEGEGRGDEVQGCPSSGSEDLEKGLFVKEV